MMSAAMVMTVLATLGTPADPAPPGCYDYLLTRARQAAADRAARGLSENVTGGVATIAILPLEGDRNGAMRRQLVIAASRAGLTVVVRDDLKHIQAEHEFTDRHKDLFGAAPAGSPGRALEADAVVYGSVTELGLLNGRGHCRLTVTAADVQTAAVIWGDSVTGTSDDAPPDDTRALPFRPNPLPMVWALLRPARPWIAGAALLILVLVLIGMVRRRRGRARREALARRLIAACTRSDNPLADVIDRARASLRRAQAALADRGQVDSAALVLDERVRLERLRRRVHGGSGGLDPALLFGASSASAVLEAPTAEDVAEDVLRRAAQVETSVEQGGQELSPLLVALRRACRRLANVLDAVAS